MRFQRKAFLPSVFTFKQNGHDNWCGHILLATQTFKLQSASFQIADRVLDVVSVSDTTGGSQQPALKNVSSKPLSTRFGSSVIKRY